MTAPPPASRQLALRWLQLGLAALVFAGIYAILLVSSRTPGVAEHLPWLDFFHTALVVHVDLSVLIWFLSLSGVLWTWGSAGPLPALDRPALWLAAAGTALIVLSPFTGEGKPLINNYVPVLQQPVFLAGLGLFGGGILLKGLAALAARSIAPAPLAMGLRLAAFTTLVSILLLPVSHLMILPRVGGAGYYELLFWGPGHVLQLTHTLLVLVVWIGLAPLSPGPAGRRLLGALFLLIALPVVVAPLIYGAGGIDGGEFRNRFTTFMRHGGLASLPLLLYALHLWFRRRVEGDAPVAAAMRGSLLLFVAGGILGFMIEGVNVVIPAHYHGSIVGITLAYMGLAYALLPRLGIPLTLPRLARWQAWIYTVGQLMHISGLAWSGGYGVARKVAGSAQGLEQLQAIWGMRLMGAGGGIAIIGGVLFLVVCLHALWRGRGQESQ
ncbi:MAG: cbb3-type cytochrome c oxidase subunit I [Gammaproteobacteria bacterium]|nr:MAG: cbb3-type cytochrome c oxidase subunit I [Gammaproteobacteria bacterium]